MIIVLPHDIYKQRNTYNKEKTAAYKSFCEETILEKGLPLESACVLFVEEPSKSAILEK